MRKQEAWSAGSVGNQWPFGPKIAKAETLETESWTSESVIVWRVMDGRMIFYHQLSPCWYNGAGASLLPGCTGPDRRTGTSGRGTDPQGPETMQAGNRQATPLRREPPEPDLETSGRKSGDAHGMHGCLARPTGSVTEHHQAPQPESCPQYHGPLVGTGTAEQLHTEIPRQLLVSKFFAHLGLCTGSDAPVSWQHSLTNSHALETATGQTGFGSQATGAPLQTQAELSCGKVATAFSALIGITLTPVECEQNTARTCSRPGSRYQMVLTSLPYAKKQPIDEIGGDPAWHYVWAGDTAAGDDIDSQRSADILERVSGADRSGEMDHEGYDVDNLFACTVYRSYRVSAVRIARKVIGGGRIRCVPGPVDRAIHRGDPPSQSIDQTCRTKQGAQVAGFDDRLVALLPGPSAVPEYAMLMYDQSLSWNNGSRSRSIQRSN